MANERKDQGNRQQGHQGHQGQQGGSKESGRQQQQQQGDDKRGNNFRDNPDKAREAGRKGGER